jgi:hypothetical protein
LKIDAVVYIRLLLLFVNRPVTLRPRSLCRQAHCAGGNSAYQEVAPLSNPANDANAVATSLSGLV